ncbi:MAG: CBS domain-containing protein [candidate division KSB1 bacterium]|nr:CBS domain-containing protein [candidate division KSB1 bacterium]MDZ7302595.1 CBS domain-containing protein [candidate division KSB1 bacterium]MDZ7311564.1 CBS domain-containing protein [candidate division KSB1 bacterium]
MNLLKIARVPPITVLPEATVAEAVEAMKNAGVGAVAVVRKNNKLVGIFTERDLMLRVVHAKLPVKKTLVGEVMTRSPVTATTQLNCSEALALMEGKHFRHLPIVDDDGKIMGMLSIRHLLKRLVEDLSGELEAIDAYLCADGPGGD